MSTIQSLWIGKHLSKLEQLVIVSYLANGHVFHLYTYGKIANIPLGTVVMDANEILPAQHIFKAWGGYAIFADWFRWELLKRKGNYWVDMDLVCLKPFDFSSDIVFGLQDANLANVSILKFPSDHPLCGFMANVCKFPNHFLPYDSARRKLRKVYRFLMGNKRSNVTWGGTGGPHGFTEALKYFDLTKYGLNNEIFYPVPFNKWHDLFTESDLNLDSLKAAYAVHLWNEILSKDGSIDKNAHFPDQSLIEQLKRKYLVS